MKPADEQRDGSLIWHITRDTYLVGGENFWRLESAILDCRHNDLGRFELTLTNQQAEAILEQITRIYEKAKRKSFFDLEGWGFPEGEYTLDIVEADIVMDNRNGYQRLTVHNVIVEGPNGSTEFQGEKIMNSFTLQSQKSWPFIQRLFKACGLELADAAAGQDLQITELKGLVKGLPGKRYDASMKRVGTDRTYVSIYSERVHGVKAPYR